MLWLGVLLGVLVMCFGLVLFCGAPYLPTRKQQAAEALDLLGLSSGQILYELGAGTGGLSMAAARQGIKVQAIELNPLLWAYLKIRTYNQRGLISVKLANFWSVDLGEADGIYVFLHDRFMPRLANKFLQQAKVDAVLVSYTFQAHDLLLDKQTGPLFRYVKT